MSTFGTSGFLFSRYIENVKAEIERVFYTAGPYPIIESVHFAPTAPYEVDAGEFVPAAGEAQARINCSLGRWYW